MANDLAHFAQGLAAAVADSQTTRDRERMELELSQPLVQTFRRRRPRSRGAETPLFDPQQQCLQED